MSALLTDATENGPGASIQLSQPVTILAHGVFDGAWVEIEMSLDDSVFVFIGMTDQDYGVFNRPGVMVLSPEGTYYVRATVHNAGPNTSLSVVANDA